MKRLTKKNKEDNAYYYPFCFDAEKCAGMGTSEKCGTCELTQMACTKLGEYEDLEEQGKMLKLPCAVGDTVYADSRVFGVLEYEVDNIVINKTITYQCSAYSKPIGDYPSECLDEIEPDISEFGKIVFLTKESAEAALKVLEI